MSAGLTFTTWSIGRKLASAYGAAGVVLLAMVALRGLTLEAWFWRAVMAAVLLVVSLRSALVWSYRRKPSQLSWWLRPTAPAEREFMVSWLIYAVFFGASSLLVLFV